MSYEIYKKNICSNCGRIGHESKYCHEPITSYGIINIRIVDEIHEHVFLRERFSTLANTYYKIISKKYPSIKCYISNNINLIKNNQNFKLDNYMIPYDNDHHIHRFCFYKDKIMFQMVSRKFSLGYIEFMRGKYDISDVKSIINLFEQMTENEINNIRISDFDDILYDFINRKNEPKEIVLNRIYEGRYSIEYCEAKVKFNMLLKPSDDNNVPWGLNFYTKIKPRWKKPEWGFPKGRREKKTEENLVCACREFEEETGYKKDDYSILNKIEPIEEKLIGTNGINYKHIYYLALDNLNNDNKITEYDTFEIGDIRWFTYHEAMSHIRPYHHDKQRILTKVYLFILNYLIEYGNDFFN